MNLKQMIEEQTEKTLLSNGGGWLVIARVLSEQVEALTETVSELTTRMAMYDAPVADVEEEVLPVEKTVEVTTLPESETDVIKSQLAGLIKSGDAERDRKHAGLSAASVGKQLGVTGGAVRGWETGNWFPAPGVAGQYLDLLLSLRHGTKVEGSPEKKEPQPNGKLCAFCKRPLVGQQKRFCSTQCASRFGYVKAQNPEATNSEVMTIIASAGVVGKSRKYRKYRKLDEVKAKSNLDRARKSEVPALS